MVSLNYLTKRSIFQQFTKSNFSLLFIAIILIIVGNFLTIFLPLSIGWFYELAFGEYGTKSSLLKHFPYRIQDLNSYFTLFIVLLFLRTGIAFCEKYAVGVLGERFSRDLREKTFDAQLHHSLSSHQLRPVGKYLLRYSGDLIAIQNLMSKGILLFLGDVSFLILSTIVLFLINPYLAIPVVVWFSFSGFILFLLGTNVRNAAVERRTQRSLNLGFVSSRMNAFFTLKSFNRETPEQKSFYKRSNKLYKLSLKYIGISSLVKTLPSFFFYTMLGIVFYTTIQIEGDLLRHKSDVFAFVLLLLYMQSVLNRLLKVNIVWQVGIISFQKLLNLINLPSESRPIEKNNLNLSGAISFKNVSFAYGNNEPVLKDISFQIFPNSLTIIKGNQGCGKSTLFKLIQNLYPPQHGEISFDGINYKNYTPFEIRKEVTIVSDEAPLLGATIFKAVSYNTSELKRQKAIAMLKKLEVQLPCKEEEILEFKVDDGGKNISAGQRIKLQFARAFLTRKTIILIDNVFGALDKNGQEVVISELNKLRKKHTILIVDSPFIHHLKIDHIVQL